MTDSSSDPERPRRTLSLGIRRKPRPERTDDGADDTPVKERAKRPLLGRRKPDVDGVDDAGMDAPAADEQPTAVGQPVVDADVPADAEEPRPRRTLGFGRKPRPGEAASSNGQTPPDGVSDDEGGDRPEDRPPTPGRLRRERRALIEQRQGDVYNLGGIAFELYRRDLLSGELLNEKALAIAALDAHVRDIDAQLELIEDERRARRDARGRKEDPRAEAGCCLTCQATFRAEAAYCWRCGSQVNPTAGANDEDTAVIATPTS